MRISYKGQSYAASSAKSPKKPTNLSVNSDLIALAKELDIYLSATLESALVKEISQRQRELWLKENAQAIAAYNRFVEEEGVFSDEFRSF